MAVLQGVTFHSYNISMIFQPQFPQGFLLFLSSIVAHQLRCDRLRASLSPALFPLLDSSRSSAIFLEDLYIFLKKKGVNLNKKELKFVNRYFGFNRSEKLSPEEFERNFLRVRDPGNEGVEKNRDQGKGLVELVVAVVQGFNEVEELRAGAAKEAEELRACLGKFYQDESGVISKEVLREVLSMLKLYSRLNSTLLCNYVIGEEGKEITLKQLFLFQASPSTEHQPPKEAFLPSSPQESKENKKLPLALSTPDKVPGTFKLKTESTDILLQIENIQSAIKQKKEMYTQRKKMLEEECKGKPVGTLRKRPSQTDLKCLPKEVQEIRESPFQSKESIDSYLAPREEMYFTQPIPTTHSRQHSQHKYSFIDCIEGEREGEAREVEELLRTRMSSKSKEEVLSKASSCARLKIQEIERRVMGRVGQRAAASKPQEYASRLNSSELRSRYSSLTRN